MTTWVTLFTAIYVVMFVCYLIARIGFTQVGLMRVEVPDVELFERFPFLLGGFLVGLPVLLVVLVVVGLFLRRSGGRKFTREIAYDEGTHRHPPRLTIAGEEVPLEQIKGIILIESTGELDDVRWDLSLVGRSDDVDIARTCRDHAELRRLALALSEALGLELNEMSVTGTIE